MFWCSLFSLSLSLPPSLSLSFSLWQVVSVMNLLVSYEHKLLFCPVQKSASTLWTQLMCRLTGDPHW